MPNTRLTWPNKLLTSIANNQCVLFAGAGLPKQAYGLPLWGEFVREVRDEIEFDDEDEVTDENIEQYRLEFLEYAKMKHAAEYVNAVNDALSPRAGGIPRSYDALTSMVFAAIITTNLDDAFERAFTNKSIPYVAVANDIDITKLADKSGAAVIKMHGSVNGEQQVLTSSEYLDFDLNRRTMQSLVLSYVTQHPMLIIGAGLSDPNFIKLHKISADSLGRFKEPTYYVGDRVPKFVKSVWKARNMIFVQVPHENLEEWLRKLHVKVQEKSDSGASRESGTKVQQFSKARALLEIGRRLESYADLQSLYTSVVHMPDFNLFQDQWEQTLYSPIRSRVREIVASIDHTLPTDFFYGAPGPHSPVLDDLREIADQCNIETIYLADIDQTVFGVEQSPEPPQALSVVCDFTAGVGQVMCDDLALRFTEGVDPCDCLAGLPAAIDVLKKCIETAGGEDSLRETLLEQVRETVIRPPRFAYSEMVASFAATPVLMSCRTRIFTLTAGLKDSTIRQALTSWCTEFWQHFNDWFYGFHLHFLTSLVSDDGIIVLVFDVTKVFNDSRIEDTESFRSSTGSLLEGVSGLELMHKDFVDWTDHDADFDVQILDANVNDFRKHSHRVAIVEYRKRAAR